MSAIQTPVTVGSEIVLLLDDHIVAETRHCRQVIHAAEKDPANPMLTAAEPWEGRGP